jgi:hypothetical protein
MLAVAKIRAEELDLRCSPTGVVVEAVEERGRGRTELHRRSRERGGRRGRAEAEMAGGELRQRLQLVRRRRSRRISATEQERLRHAAAAASFLSPLTGQARVWAAPSRGRERTDREEREQREE